MPLQDLQKIKHFYFHVQPPPPPPSIPFFFLCLPACEEMATFQESYLCKGKKCKGEKKVWRAEMVVMEGFPAFQENSHAFVGGGQ